MSTETAPRLKLEQYLGLQIKRQRQAQDLKLSDVAKIADISQGMLSKIENAQVSTSLDTLSRLCDVLGLPLSKLFAEYDQQDGSALLAAARGRLSWKCWIGWMSQRGASACAPAAALGDCPLSPRGRGLGRGGFTSTAPVSPPLPGPLPPGERE